MPPSSNTSFIPKQSGNKIERKNTPRRIFIGTIITRILFFAVLLVAVGLFFYERRLSDEVARESAEINAIASRFDVNQMESILAFDKRLIMVNQLFSNSFSSQSLLDLIANNTIASVQIKSIEVAREGSSAYKVTAEMSTDIYDSVIRQRNAFAENSNIEDSEVIDVNREIILPSSVGDVFSVNQLPVSFKATLLVERSVLPIINTVSSGGVGSGLTSPQPQLVTTVEDVAVIE